MLKLTPAEIDRYAPYHTFPEFKIGFEDWMEGRYGSDRATILTDPFGVGGQAYDRGAECAMRRQMAEYRTKSERTGYDREW